MTDELKPLECPFCGGKAFLIEDEPTKGFYVVECADCAAHGPMSSREHAVKAWNRRAAVTDHDFAIAVHDGNLWGKCSECERIARLESERDELVRDMYLTWKRLDLEGDWPTSGHNGWKTFEGRIEAMGIEGCL